jgi:hypothetical protein
MLSRNFNYDVDKKTKFIVRYVAQSEERQKVKQNTVLSYGCVNLWSYRLYCIVPWGSNKKNKNGLLILWAAEMTFLRSVEGYTLMDCKNDDDIKVN